MLNQALSEKNLISLPKPCKNGQIQVRLKVSKQKKTVEDYSTIKASLTTSVPPIKITLPTEKKSVMQESLKKKILSDKLDSSKVGTQNTKLSKISDPVLIGKEMAFKPFWKESSMVLSKKLWLPTKTDCRDSALTSYIGCFKNLTANSWFSINLQKPIQRLKCQEMSSQSLTILSQKIMVEELPKIKKSETLRAMKIKLYPNQNQKKILKEWFGSCRWVYNQCVNYINNTKKIPSKSVLRSKFVTNKKATNYIENVPFDVRDEAVADIIKNIKSNFEKMKKQNKKYMFHLKFKKKKNAESIAIRARHYGRKTGMYAWLSEIKKSQKIEIINNDFRILKDQCGDYYICLPQNRKIKSKRQAFKFTSRNPMVGIISLDPGIRTFLTGYDPYRQNILHLGNNTNEILSKHSKTLDSLSKRIKYTKSRVKRRSYKKARRMIYKKVNNMVRDMHNKVSKFLCANYRTILLPKFDVKNMTCKKNRTISKKTTRDMLSLSHFKFRQILEEKSKLYVNCQVEIVTEEYTSKTCGNCGELNEKLGSNKTFECQKCKIVIDRDCNGCRNILLKAF